MRNERKSRRGAMTSPEGNQRFENTAYLLMALFITIFIFAFLSDIWYLLSVLMIAALVILANLTMAYLRQKKTADKYRSLMSWMEAGDMSDREGIDEEVQADLLPLLDHLDQKYSYANLRNDMEYTALQNQINPHFLYNTLDGIRSQALLAGQSEIADMTGRLSRFFRYSIRSRGDLVTLREELDNLRDYFEIQRYRFEDRFILEIEIDDQDLLRCYIPKMTFQPIVENAIYHGLEARRGKGRVTVRVEKLSASIRITVSDDGVGMDQQELEKLEEKLSGDLPAKDASGRRTGIAVYNINRRLKILFGDSCGLQYSSLPGMGTDVSFRMPLVDEKNRSRYLPAE